ncbi:hypothetical protein G3056_001227, partial [Neisseria gonorrhoeae]
GRAVCRYDTVIPIYKGGLQPAKSTNSAESAAVIPAQAGIQTCRCGNLSDKTVSLDFAFRIPTFVGMTECRFAGMTAAAAAKLPFPFSDDYLPCPCYGFLP